MRIPLAPTEGAGAHEDAVARIAALRSGEVSTLYRMLLHSGNVAAGWCELGTAVRYRSGLNDRLRELVICLVAGLTGASYEWASHEPLALDAGVTPEQLASLPQWRTGPGFSERDRAALQLAEAAVRGAVTDDDLAVAGAHFAHRGLVEVVATAAYYLATSRILQAFGVEPGD
jgi:4-carboxymuconolactone decarboxylase